MEFLQPTLVLYSCVQIADSISLWVILWRCDIPVVYQQLLLKSCFIILSFQTLIMVEISYISLCCTQVFSRNFYMNSVGGNRTIKLNDPAVKQKWTPWSTLKSLFPIVHNKMGEMSFTIFFFTFLTTMDSKYEPGRRGMKKCTIQYGNWKKEKESKNGNCSNCGELTSHMNHV